MSWSPRPHFEQESPLNRARNNKCGRIRSSKSTANVCAACIKRMEIPQFDTFEATSLHAFS